VNKTATHATGWFKELESSITKDKDLAPAFKELKAVKSKLQKALEQDKNASPLANQTRRRT